MDCLEGMKLLDDNSIDSIVTDPPYELGFMGKKWDSTGIAYNIDIWRECLRVLKPGGHLLAFGGTRTYHRMTCAIEDAGFEIRDCIQWLYGSGFPKSHDISKAIDKKLGAERKFICENPNARPNSQPKYSLDGQNKNFQISVQPITAPATPEAQQWDGWGTALKPANEPIVLARKPISEKTIAENVLKWGTGGINIDDCRIELQEEGEDKRLGGKGTWKTEKMAKNVYKGGYSGEGVTSSKLGRFPANVILDEKAGKLLDEQSGILKSGALKPYQENHRNASSYKMNRYKTFVQPANEGGASRFFYCAKASKKERGEGNNHPTAKPVSLIKYLVTLVTPPDGVCLDPFMGSGTTGVACINTNRNFIGIELDDKYFEIAKQRISEAQNKPEQITMW
jgi:site-specific DNA-methyltransferase (adenine-specific)